MSWTYDAENLLDPLNDDYEKDQVRFYIGDTQATAPQLQDEEILMLLANASSPLAAAIMATRSLIAKYSRGVDKWVGDLKILASQRVRQYTDLLTELTEQNGIVGTPSAGGVYASEKQEYEQNTSLVQGYFRGGMDDNTQE